MESTQTRRANLHDELEADFEDVNELEGPEEQPIVPNKFWEFNSGVLCFIIGCAFLETLMAIMSTPKVPLWSTLPFLFIPFLLLVFCSWFWHAKITTVGTVIQQFLVGATFVTSCVSIAQSMLYSFWIVFAVGFASYKDQSFDSLTNATELWNTTVNMTNASFSPAPTNSTQDVNAVTMWKDVATFLFLSLISFSVPECLVTYYVTIQSNYANHHNKNFIINSLYVGLGYATGNSFLLVVSQALREEIVYAKYVFPKVPWYDLILWTANYLVMSAPLQMLVGYGVGLLIAEAREKGRPVSWKRCNLMAWIVRSFYYFFYFGWVYMQWWNSWVFLACVLVEAIGFVVWIKLLERTMPAEYLAKVGYLHAFGYGVIPQVEDLSGYEQHEMTSATPQQPGDSCLAGRGNP